MKIYIDGDACPVKEIVYRESDVHQLSVVLVTSLSHYSQKPVPAHVDVVYVDEGADAADYRLVALIKAGDILITQDYGLASLALPKNVQVCHHLGYSYTPGTIDQMLETRYLGAQLRKSGQRTKGPKKFTKANEEEFTIFFRKILANALK